MDRNTLLRRHVGALVTLALPVPLALAQSAPPRADRAPIINLTDILVTAQKREQKLQDVPISITVVSDQLLQDTGVKDIKDLMILAPGLTVTSTTSEAVTTARLRGVGTAGDNPGLESSVGVVIDGVYRPRNGVGFGDLGELDRIEVLKGPQGTLFGKNNSAGVINILTKQPDFKYRANATLSGGNYSNFEADAVLNGPIVDDKLAGRLYAARSKRDGYYDTNIANGPRTANDDANRDLKTVRGQLLYQPTEVVSVRFIGDYSERSENCCAGVQVNVGPTAPIINALSPDGGVANPADPFARRTFSNRSTAQDIRDEGAAAEVNWDVYSLGGKLTSITAWRNWRVINGQDSDFTTADIWFRAPDGHFGNEFDQVSQEVRLAGASGALNWLVGAFYANENLTAQQNVAYGSQFEPYYGLLFSQGTNPNLIANLTGRAPGTSYALNAGDLDRFDQQSNSYALFTNESFQFTDQLEGTLGARYTREDKDLDSSYANLGGGSAGCAASRARRALVNAAFAGAPAGTAQSYFAFGCGVYADPAFDSATTHQMLVDSQFGGTAKLAYRFTMDAMTYVSYARGYKAGGFNLDREVIVNPALGAADPASMVDTDTHFAPETVDSYELGAKTSWLDRNVLVNATAFYESFDNFQLNTFIGTNFVVASIPRVTSKGMDVDLLWSSASRRFNFQGGVTYAETTYGSFAPGPGISPRLPNNTVSFAPRWSGTLAATYAKPIGSSLVFRTNVSAKTTSSYNTGSDLNPGKQQSAFTLVNARLGLGSESERWMLEAWGQNLLNRDYYQLVYDAPLQPGSLDAYLGAPRTYGLTLRVSF